MFNNLLYVIAILLFIVSFFKDKQKTNKALRIAWKSFSNILPAMAGVLALVGLALTILSADTISRIVGSNTGVLGMILTSAIGAITLIPGFIAFPLAASLMEKGAGVMQMAVFISTLMMVGIVTLPLEIKYFGKRTAVLRNAFAFIFSFIVAIVIGVVAA